ncbi:MAG: phosphatase PAP2 family protein [Proteobacteria bacterium]|nr:phosphatase PAP2 family protein [Pseudomonadota bacterium]
MLASLVDSVVAFSRAHQDLAYGVIFLVALSEALPVFGAFVPGDAIILGISALVPTGALSLGPLIAAATAGAVISDGFAFWLGRRYRRAAVSRWPFSRHPAMLDRGEQFLRRHGGKSVFIARFTPGVRAIVPLLAGILEMSSARFYLMNVLSAVIWGPVHILAGAAIGATLVVLGAVAGRLAMLAALLIVLLAALIWGMRLAVRRLPPLTAAAEERLWDWARRRDTWLGRQLLSILDPTRRELPGLVLLGAILGASLWLFFGVLQDVLTGDPLVRANESVYHFLQALRTVWVDRAMVAITELGDPTVIAAVAAAAILWLLWRRSWRGAAHLAAALAATSLFTLLMKFTLRLPRPYEVSSGWEFFAFPSGHSAANAALYGFLAVLVAWEVRTRWRVLMGAFATLLVAAIAFSRVYLGAHWLSDVLAGLAFGTAWAAFLGIAYVRRNPRPVGAGGLCAAAGLALLLTGAVHVGRQHAKDIRRYARRSQVMTLAASQWWREGWSQLPVRRVDLAGQIGAPLTVQWAGTAAALARELAADGWKAPVPWSLRSAVAWLKPHAPLASLPVLPHLESGRPEVLVLTLPAGGRAGQARLVLRLWRSDVRLAAPGAPAVPVLLGTVAEEHIERPTWFLTTTQQLPVYDGPRDRLAADIPAHRMVERGPKLRSPGWDGRVLLGSTATAPLGGG